MVGRVDGILESVDDRIEIQCETMFRMETVGCIEHQVQDQAAVLIHVVVHHVVAKVKGQLVFEEGLREVEVPPVHFHIIKFVVHRDVVQAGGEVGADRNEPEVVHEHGIPGVGVGHVGGLLVSVVERGETEV